jgi:DNA-binding transcriptional ArsR family regulator
MPNVTCRDYDLDDEVIADRPEVMKALADPLRMQICDLVLERAMSVTELAARVGRPKGTVAYHVDVLADAGLLKIVRTRKVRAVEERFYGRVARTIVYPHDGDDSLAFVREVLGEVDLAAYRGDATPGIVTLRHARIPFERVEEYRQRLLALALEFIDEPRGGEVEFGMYLALYPTTRSVGTADDADPEEPS